MTGYSAGALDDLKLKIAKAAIKWQLREVPIQWDGDADSGFYGMGWDGTLPPVGGPTGTVELLMHMPGLGMMSGMPPGCQHVGDTQDAAGQPVSKYHIDPWTSIYEPWISKINDAFEGWDGLPDPADFQGPVDHVRTAVTLLTPTSTSAGGNDPNGNFSQTYSDPDLMAAMDDIHQYLGRQSDGNDGALIYAFNHSYGAARINSVLGNQAQVAIGLGVSLLAEQKIWEGARKDIMAIADKAVTCFKPGGAGGDSIDLGVVQAFAGLIGTFAPPPVSTVLAAGSATIDLVEKLLPQKTPGDDSVKIEGYSIDEVYASMCDQISKLEQRTYDQEYEVAYHTLSGINDAMHTGDATMFHINPVPGLDPDLLKAPNMSVHPAELEKVGYKSVPIVAAVMGKAAEAALAADNGSMWVRPNQIGLGYDGPYYEWSKLQKQFDQVTTGSGHELVEAGARLAEGAGFIRDADGDQDAALAGVRDDLDRGQDGWDNTVPSVSTGPYGLVFPY